MAYNPALYMPQAYQPLYQPSIPQQIQQPQAMTPPVRQASIIQISTPGDEDRFQLQPDAPQMFMTADDMHIVIKTLTANGADKIYYDKRPPAPEPKPFDPAEYVRRDEIQTLVSSILEANREGKE